MRARLPRLAGLALAVGLVLVPAAAPAQAAAKITTQPFVSVVGLDDLKAQGLDGTGVTIALIDGPVDRSVPELAGADIADPEDFCKDKPASAKLIGHATTVASLLVSPDYGWAPKAKLLNYVNQEGDVNDLNRTCFKNNYSDTGFLINQALNDHADVIVVTMVGDWGPSVGYAVARASLHGVPVFVGVGNDGKRNVRSNGKPSTYITTAAINGTIGVGSGDLNGRRSTFSNYGWGMDIVAPGEKITHRVPDAKGALTKIEVGRGTSFATPMVAGAFALAKQKWPNATGNQLLRTMLATSVKADGQTEWMPDFGWGNFSPSAWVAEDPSTQESTNPFATKNPTQLLSPQEWADYADGVAPTLSLYGDEEYVYRGNNPLDALNWPKERVQLGTSPRFASASASPAATTAAPAATPSAAPTPAPVDNTPVLIGVTAAVVVIGGVAAVVLSRRKRPTA